MTGFELQASRIETGWVFLAVLDHDGEQIVELAFVLETELEKQLEEWAKILAPVGPVSVTIEGNLVKRITSIRGE